MKAKEIVETAMEELKANNIIVIAVTERSSEGYYNYKTKKLYVLWLPRTVGYEEPLERNVYTVNLYVGAFQEMGWEDVFDVVDTLKAQGAEVVEVEIY